MDQEAVFEHQFWLQILGDHSRFIYNALSPKEVRDIATAESFMNSFDQLLLEARQLSNSEPLIELNKAALQYALSLRTFKLDLLERLLLGKLVIGLTPTFINHMVNELEEYLRILNELVQGNPVPHYQALHHDLLWLPDAAGHAASLAMELDAVEKRLIKQSHSFEKHFNAFFLKAIELTGYLRTIHKHYPSIVQFHQDVNLEMLVFMNFLKEIEEMELSDRLLSRLNPLVPDHMFREECYYLMKLAQCGDITPPNCNPAKPRVIS